MRFAEIAQFLRLAGYDVEETTSGVWYGVGHGFFVRVPPYVAAPPTEAELAQIWRRRSVVGVKYSLPPSSSPDEANGGIYIVRDATYDFPHLQATQRRKVRRGLEACTVRPLPYTALIEEGLILNQESLARQRREDSILGNAARWAHFCHAGAVCEGAVAWGAFVEGELASYAALFVANGVVHILHTMSRNRHLKRHCSPALIFALTRHWMRQPGIQAVSFGPAGLSSWEGLDRFKAHMGFRYEPLTFAVRFRPLAEWALLNPATKGLVSMAIRLRPTDDTMRRVQRVLDLAAVSLRPRHEEEGEGTWKEERR